MVLFLSTWRARPSPEEFVPKESESEPLDVAGDPGSDEAGFGGRGRAEYEVEDDGFEEDEGKGGDGCEDEEGEERFRDNNRPWAERDSKVASESDVRESDGCCHKERGGEEGESHFFGCWSLRGR